MKSLDPRVNRLPPLPEGVTTAKPALDQLCTFEVFVQPRGGKPFQHEGALHASDLEMAFVLAKETFTRRFTCSALWVVETSRVFFSPTTEGSQSAYGIIPVTDAGNAPAESFEIFHLPKRGKQHVHCCSVEATTPDAAMTLAGRTMAAGAVFYNIWAIRSADIRRTYENEMDLWSTLPDKRFRDASAYKGGDKLKEFLERNKEPK